MAAKWKTIVITSPGEVQNEAWRIVRILTGGAADIVHIRKPDWDKRRVRDLLTEIPVELHPQLRLHDNFDLLDTFPAIGGVHLNSRNPHAPQGARCVSRSCHTLAELKEYRDCDYLFLSPVFDSISKIGYGSAFTLESMKGELPEGRVIALGGVTPQSFPALRKAGFIGAALLGYVWGRGEEAEYILARRSRMMKHFSLQFITDAPEAEGTVRQVFDALAGGCRWIQVRMKDAPVSEIRKVLLTVRQAVAATGAILLVDDHVELAKELHIDGVHLGKNDMPPAEAREILGEAPVIGCTANNMEDVCTIAAGNSADYIGMGPFRFTTTKKNLAPVLGLDGYRRLTGRMRQEKIDLPVVAIGGIMASDIPELLHSGPEGVAVSGAIARAANPEAATRHIINEINKSKGYE